EETRVPRVVVHEADRVEVDEHADAGDHEQHHAGERIDEGDHRRLEVGGHDPREERRGEGLAGPHAREDDARAEERGHQRRHRDPVRGPSDHASEHHVDERAREREGGDQPDGGHRANLAGGRRGVKQRRGIIRVVPPRSRFKAGLLAVLLVIFAIVAPISYLGWRQTVPGVRASRALPRFIGQTPAFTVTLEASRGNVTRAEVRVVQGGRPVTVAKSDAPPGPRAELPVRFETASLGVPGQLKPRAFPRDTIKISDAFLQIKVPELLPQRPPSQPLLDAFLVINREQRKQAETTKREVGARTAETPLWEGPFTQPRNTKVFSNFAETRTYVYEGRAVDTQVHYGYDLASTKQSPVPAANA